MRWSHFQQKELTIRQPTRENGRQLRSVQFRAVHKAPKKSVSSLPAKARPVTLVLPFFRESEFGSATGDAMAQSVNAATITPASTDFATFIRSTLVELTMVVL